MMKCEGCEHACGVCDKGEYEIADVSDSPELPSYVPEELLAVFIKTRQRLYIQARTNEDYLFVSYCDSIIKKYKKTDDCST